MCHTINQLTTIIPGHAKSAIVNIKKKKTSTCALLNLKSIQCALMGHNDTLYRKDIDVLLYLCYTETRDKLENSKKRYEISQWISILVLFYNKIQSLG